MAVNISAKFYAQDPTTSSGWEDLSKIVFTSPNLPSPSSAGTRSNILPGEGEIGLWYETLSNMYKILDSQPNDSIGHYTVWDGFVIGEDIDLTTFNETEIVISGTNTYLGYKAIYGTDYSTTTVSADDSGICTVTLSGTNSGDVDDIFSSGTSTSNTTTSTSGTKTVDGYYYIGACGNIYEPFGIEETYIESPEFNVAINKYKSETRTNGWIGADYNGSCFIDFEFDEATRVVRLDLSDVLISYTQTGDVTLSGSLTTWSGTEHTLTDGIRTVYTTYTDAWSLSSSLWKSEASVTISGCDTSGETYCYGVSPAVSDSFEETFSNLYGIRSLTLKARNSEVDAWTVIYTGSVNTNVECHHENYYKYYRLEIDGGVSGVQTPLTEINLEDDVTITISGADSSNKRAILLSDKVSDSFSREYKLDGTTTLNGWYGVGCCDNSQGYDLLHKGFYVESPTFNFTKFVDVVETKDRGWVGGDDDCSINFEFNSPRAVVKLTFDDVNYTVSGTYTSHFTSADTTWSGTTRNFNVDDFDATVTYDDDWTKSDLNKWICEISDITATTSGCTSGCFGEDYGINITSKVHNFYKNTNYDVTNIKVLAGDSLSTCDTTLYEGSFTGEVTFNPSNIKYSCYKLELIAPDDSTSTTEFVEIPLQTRATLTISGTNVSELNSGLLNTIYDEDYVFTSNSNLVQTSGIALPNAWVGYECGDVVLTESFKYKGLFTEKPSFNYTKDIIKTETRTSGWIGSKTVGDECYLQFEFETPKRVAKITFDGVYYQRESLSVSKEYTGPSLTCSGMVTTVTEDGFSTTIYSDDNWTYNATTDKWTCGVVASGTVAENCDSEDCFPVSYGFLKNETDYEASRYVKEYDVTEITVKAGDTSDSCTDILYSGVFTGTALLSYPTDKSYKFYKIFLEGSSNDSPPITSRKNIVYNEATINSSYSTQYKEYQSTSSNNSLSINRDRLDIGIGYDSERYGNFSTITFENINIPNGAIITDAYLKVKATNDSYNSSCTNCEQEYVNFYIQVARSSSPTTEDAYLNLPVVSDMSSLRVDSDWNTDDYNVFNGLTAVIQALMNEASWSSGDDLTIILKRNIESALITDVVTFFSALSDYPPTLYISWGEDQGDATFDVYEELQLENCVITTSGIDSNYNIDTILQDGTVSSGYDSAIVVSGTANVDAWFELAFSDNSAKNDFDYKNVVLERPELSYVKNIERTFYKNAGWIGNSSDNNPFVQFYFETPVCLRGITLDSVTYTTTDKTISYNRYLPTWSGSTSTFDDGNFSATVYYEDSWTLSGTNYTVDVDNVVVSSGSNTDYIIKCYGIEQTDSLDIVDSTLEYSIKSYVIKGGNTPETCTNIVYTSISGTQEDRVIFDNENSYKYYRLYLDVDNNSNPEPEINSYEIINIDYENKVTLSNATYDPEDIFAVPSETSKTIPEYTWAGASTLDVPTKKVCYGMQEGLGEYRFSTIRDFDWPFIVSETLSGTKNSTGGWLGNSFDMYIEFDYPELLKRFDFDPVIVTDVLSGTCTVTDTNGYPNRDDYTGNFSAGILTFSFSSNNLDIENDSFTGSVKSHFDPEDGYTSSSAMMELEDGCNDEYHGSQFLYRLDTLTSNVDRSEIATYGLSTVSVYGRNSTSESWILIKSGSASNYIFDFENEDFYKYYKLSFDGTSLGIRHLQLYKGSFDSSLVVNPDDYYSELDFLSEVTVTTSGFSGEDHPESVFRSGYICTDKETFNTLSGIDDDLSVGYYVNHALNETTGNYRFTDLYFVNPDFYYTKAITETETKTQGWVGRSNDDGFIQFEFDTPRKVTKMTFDSVIHQSDLSMEYTYLGATPTWSGGQYQFSSSNEYGDISAVLHFDNDWTYDSEDDKFYCTITGVSDFFSSYDSSEGNEDSEWDYDNCLGLSRVNTVSNSFSTEYEALSIIIKASNDFNNGYIELYNGTFDGSAEFFHSGYYKYYRLYMTSSCADICPDCLSTVETKEINLRNSVEISSDNSSASSLMALFETGYLYQDKETSSTLSGIETRTIENKLRYCLNNQGGYNYEEEYDVDVDFDYVREATTIATKEAGLTEDLTTLDIEMEFPETTRIVRVTGDFVTYEDNTTIAYNYLDPVYSGTTYSLTAAEITLGNTILYSSVFDKWYAEDVDSVTITASGCSDSTMYEHTSYGVSGSSSTNFDTETNYGVETIIIYGKNSESESYTQLYSGSFDGDITIAEAMCDFYKYYKFTLDAGTSYDGVGLRDLKAYKYACDDDYYSYGVSNLKMYTYSSDSLSNSTPYGIRNLSLYGYYDVDEFLYGIRNFKMYEYDWSELNRDSKFGVSNLKLIEYSEDLDNTYGLSSLVLKDYSHDTYEGDELTNYIFADNGAVYKVLSDNVTVTSGGDYVMQLNYLDTLSSNGDTISKGASLYTYSQSIAEETLAIEDSVIIEINSGECYDCYLTAWDDSTHSTTSNNAILAGEHCRVNAHAMYIQNRGGAVVSGTAPSLLDVFDETSDTEGISIFKEVINKKLKGRISSGGEDYWYGDFNMIARQNDGNLKRGGDYIIFKPYLVGIDDSIPAGIHDFIIAFHYSYT